MDLDRIVDSSDPEVLGDQNSNMFPRKERSCFWTFCSSRLILLLKRGLWMILFSAEAVPASSTSKFGIETSRIDDEDLKKIH